MAERRRIDRQSSLRYGRNRGASPFGRGWAATLLRAIKVVTLKGKTVLHERHALASHAVK